MMGRIFAAAAAAASMTALASCSSDGATPGAGTPEGGGVGAPCSADSQCTGYTNASCVEEVKPIANLVDASDPKNKLFVDFNVPFPGGYCSNTTDNSCASDADCGDGAGCFHPFEGVPQSTIDKLNGLGLPFDINAFADFALCLKTCDAPSDCRTNQGYACEVPLKAFMSTLNPGYTRTFCFVNVDRQIMGLLGTSPDAGP
jgi:hypothetical protein